MFRGALKRLLYTPRDDIIERYARELRDENKKFIKEVSTLTLRLSIYELTY